MLGKNSDKILAMSFLGLCVPCGLLMSWCVSDLGPSGNAHGKVVLGLHIGCTQCSSHLSSYWQSNANETVVNGHH